MNLEKEKNSVLIRRAIESSAILFGDFKLKSGRNSKYFFNAGNLYSDGENLNLIANSFSEILIDWNMDGEFFNYLFGPAYKGIPLVSSVVAILYEKFKLSVPWGYNRKETKDHGEGGLFVGSEISSRSRVVIIDDVITAGTAIRESINLIESLGAQVVGVLVILDRQERDDGGLVRANLEIKSLLTASDLFEYIEQRSK